MYLYRSERHTKISEGDKLTSEVEIVRIQPPTLVLGGTRPLVCRIRQWCELYGAVLCTLAVGFSDEIQSPKPLHALECAAGLSRYVVELGDVSLLLDKATMDHRDVYTHKQDFEIATRGVYLISRRTICYGQVADCFFQLFGMNNIGYYNRRACQRCHAQKLSCRPETQTECIRCIKANTKCLPRSPLRTRKGNNSSEQRPQHSRHSVSRNDKSEPVQSTTELPNFSDDIWGGICAEEATRDASEGPESKTPIILKAPFINDFQ